MDDWDLEVSPCAKTYSPDKRLEEFLWILLDKELMIIKKDLAKWLFE